MEIQDYIEKNFKLENLVSIRNKDFNDVKNYYEDAKADAIYCNSVISKYLQKDKKILEVGGGIHLLTNYLNQEYDVTSIEPGGFTGFTDEIRNKIINKKDLNVHTTTLENFVSVEKYDFIFSMNVLEHTKNINLHIKKCKTKKLDKQEKGFNLVC